MSTAITKAPSPKNETKSECDSSEESGWTKYFEDFLNNHFDDQKCCSSVSFSGVDRYSTSFVSAAKKMLTDDDSTQPEESSFKKRKKIKTALLVDDALEDTASSPVKGCKEKRNTQRERDESQELVFNRRDNDHTELKKKGLCLVPLSMITKYIG
ncbi:hypothetical protein PHAVU_005G093000 [Phaseolus vulgaris]|uniref:Uncharacterized protein n=1 Tax=Phaseolus vulgaris TaxID=3885 RepID=V7BUM9_PHAVU|nr:hypothetical protein PHAVU_005G093000g [Phaseolus vulgaris]ESW21707.1 hypothetical protein PHAVU_005G093000g [Phaseolus vulgaris]